MVPEEEEMRRSSLRRRSTAGSLDGTQRKLSSVAMSRALESHRRVSQSTPNLRLLSDAVAKVSMSDSRRSSRAIPLSARDSDGDKRTSGLGLALGEAIKAAPAGEGTGPGAGEGSLKASTLTLKRLSVGFSAPAPPPMA
jgi:hypothetical protein